MRFFRKKYTERDLPERYAIIVDEYMDDTADYRLYYFPEEGYEIKDGKFVLREPRTYGKTAYAHPIESYIKVKPRRRKLAIHLLVKEAKSNFNERIGEIKKSRSTLSSLNYSESAQNRSFIAP